jgi:hypothetical protein
MLADGDSRKSNVRHAVAKKFRFSCRDFSMPTKMMIGETRKLRVAHPPLG